MDNLDDLFFDHRLQKKAKVEPLFVSKRRAPCCPEPPTFDDFLSTPLFQADLMSFKPSQLMSQTQRRGTQPENEAYDVMEGSQIGTQNPKSLNGSLSHPRKRLFIQ
ncbi:uncharacterized protein LOC135477212 [Liolophura sinensis]|uniref:uncharacterized protein LOC135477212 n=1 Tax=Liolophura sinensis TaxID=3198878 RepID=UPI0031591B7F